MAEETRHAAWHDNREFRVRLIPAEGPARDLITGFTDFLAAVDYVTEWLDREDPACTDDQKVVILQTEGSVSTEVFSYPPPEESASSQELIQLYGYNPAAPRFRPDERAKPKLDRLADRLAAAPVTRAPLPATPHISPAWEPSEAPVPQPQPDPTVMGFDETVAATDRRVRPYSLPSRDAILTALRLNWDDKIARSCLIVAALSVWLSVTLADATFLLPLFASGTALWYLHHRRPIPEPDPDDWQ